MQLTDVSYVVCPGPGGRALEQFVAAGTHCQQGVVRQKNDGIEGVPATQTRTYVQYSADANQMQNTVIPISAIKR